MLVEADVLCYHCGQSCEDSPVLDGDKAFCCQGCKVVYELISSSQLCQYYDFENHPGTKIESWDDETYLHLDESAIRRKLIEFDTEEFARVRFSIPAIHCVSCIWLLENLQKANPGILHSEVNFSGKSVVIDFNPGKIKLSRLAALLASLGYAPRIVDDSGNEKPTPLSKSSITIKLAVAGFAFGNIMLFSFPEYLGLDPKETILRLVFTWLSVVLAIPVLVYSARDYFSAAWKSFAQRQINIDVPIAAGLVALFGRSVWDIATGFGPGYLDSFTGLVFFLLIGRWFQGKTYEVLAFDRDYTSYFPLAVQHWTGKSWEPVVIHELKKGERIRVRNLEIVPADSVLVNPEALMDYSFVTGESRPVKVMQGAQVFAGGRLLGQPVELVVERATSQSHLTGLWNHDAFRKTGRKYKKIIDRAARRFTWIVMAIALITAGYWYFANPSEMWLVLTSVLMVACPCALALAAPFTYGSMLRAFGQGHLYLKNADVIERLASIDTVVFDKTGTVTHGKDPEVIFEGRLLPEERVVVKQLTGSSTHPLSSLITKSIREKGVCELNDFREIPGLGIEGSSGGHYYRIGSGEFCGVYAESVPGVSRVFVSVDEEVQGFFVIRVSLRKDIEQMIRRLGLKCSAMLSGDGESDKERMRDVFPENVGLYFNQSPQEKMDFIKSLQRAGKKVLMVGDGLNDAGALRQSDVGIAVTDDTGIFTPACDGILEGNRLASLDRFLAMAKSSTTILKAAFVISFLYNAIALGVAVTGHLTPLVAAILMPISSISVVSFSTLAVNYASIRQAGRTEKSKVS